MEEDMPGMDMGGGDGDGTMGHMEMTMTMVMTFGSWKDYQLQLLWESWDIEEEWQYALSWIAVFLAVVLYHGVHYVIYSVESAMRKKRHAQAAPTTSDVEGDVELGFVDADKEPVTAAGSSYSLIGGNKGPTRLTRHSLVILRIMHAVLGGVSYGLAMLLMLVAMTYNPGLFVALIAGYTAGDFIFFRLSGSSPDSGCH